MSLLIGDINILEVDRKTDIGYMLKTGNEEVFLHNNEIGEFELVAGTTVKAFLYVDHRGRLTATLATPKITISDPGYLSVIDVVPNLGVFLDNGVNKDILLSNDFLPYNKELWPHKGDVLYCVLKVKNKLVAKIANKEEIKLVPDDLLEIKDEIEATVYKTGAYGINLLSLLGHQIFVHKTHLRKPYRVGEKVLVRIVFVNGDNDYNGSLIKQKEELLFDDANDVLTYLIRNNYEMNLTSESSTEDILATFNISKRAFKRALGTLYRERKIDFVDGKTILFKKGDQND